MRLETLTDDQRRSVEHVSGPLLISAGAGSGKTFTLTQRIVYALLPGGPVDDIDQVLAITFTEKAATEIKARVRSTLRQEGLIEQALKVDAAWISTIHGMCARILRIHALELGVDPGFEVIDDATRKDMITEAINEALDQDNTVVSPGRYETLFSEFAAGSSFAAQDSISSMLEMLINKAATLRNGFDDILLGPAPADPASLAKDLLQAYEEVIPGLEEGGQSDLAVEARADAAATVERLHALLAEWGGHGRPGPQEAAPTAEAAGADAAAEAPETDAAAEAPEADAPAAAPATTEADATNAGRLATLARLMDQSVAIARRFGSKEVKAAVGLWQQEYFRISQEVLLGLARPAFDELLALAREVAQGFEEKKREAFVLDNDDLLTMTLKAFDQDPGIAQAYQGRFRLVMVDEFQDTSQVQIDIIERLSGRNDRNLCTVGDSQQSIYRFRGADVNVYEQHKRKMRSKRVDALYVELKKNFRSHGDILRFVDRVFGQPQVFGERFMSLEPDAGRVSSYQADAPRIDIVLAMRPGGNNTGVSLEDAKRVEAQAIAKRFTAAFDAGHDPGDMVLLLGKMTRAELFAQAIRDEGFECVITGGSLFDQAPEVHIVARLAQVLANPGNTSALFEVLISDMFGLSADDLIRLSTMRDPDSGALRRCDLSYGFRRLAASLEAGGEDVPLRLQNAVHVLDKAQKAVGFVPVAQIAEDAVLDSGWMTRLSDDGASGIAQAANILKAIRHIEGLEEGRGLGVAQLAQEFSKQLASGLKEAPGALSGDRGGVVKIMSIHASKGLEFPIVALAEFSGTHASQDKLVVEACDGKAYASLSPSETLAKYPALQRKAASFSPYEEGEPPCGYDQCMQAAPSQALYRAAVKAFAQTQELAEVRRKLYVGLTRASEALIISLSARGSSRDPLSAYKDVADDLRSALRGNEDFPTGTATLEYGGSQPALFERITVSAQAPAGEEGEAQGSVPSPRQFFVPVFSGQGKAPLGAYRPLREGVFSYSSLAPAAHPQKEGPGQAQRGASPLSATAPPQGAPLGHDGPQGLEAAVPGPPAAGRTGAFDGLDGEGAAIRPFVDADKATDLGSAFHLLAQYALEAKKVPTTGRIDQVTAAYRLSPQRAGRLKDALARWFSSDLYARVSTYGLACAELPFFVPLGDGWLEGDIDAFCSNGKKGSALVIDYKTGGSKDEDAASLHEKHLLQASCYAYAVLSQGYPEVELEFVRVEQEEPASAGGKGEGAGAGQPQAVAYRFGKEELPDLKRAILEAR